MKQFSSLDLYKWVQKYREIIISSRITQIYRQGIFQITLALHTKENKKFLVLFPPKGLVFSDNKPSLDHKETGFGKYLRNNIKGAIIKDLFQVRSERVIGIQLNQGIMYVELYGKGNIIVCDNDNVILTSIEKQIMKTRSIAKGEKYEVPESFDVFNATEKEFNEHIKNADEDSNISLFLATECNLGGTIANEICREIEINKDAKIKEIYDKADLIIKKLQQKMQEEGDFEQFELEINNAKNIKEGNVHQKKIDKINTIIEKQSKSLKDVNAKIEKNTNIGNFIYDNYLFFDEVKKAYDYAIENNLEFNQQVLDKLIKKHNIKVEIKYSKPNLLF